MRRHHHQPHTLHAAGCHCHCRCKQNNTLCEQARAEQHRTACPAGRQDTPLLCCKATPVSPSWLTDANTYTNHLHRGVESHGRAACWPHPWVRPSASAATRCWPGSRRAWPHQSTSGSDDVLKRGLALFWSRLLATSVSDAASTCCRSAGCRKGRKCGLWVSKRGEMSMSST